MRLSKGDIKNLKRKLEQDEAELEEKKRELDKTKRDMIDIDASLQASVKEQANKRRQIIVLENEIKRIEESRRRIEDDLTQLTRELEERGFGRK